MHDYVEGGSGSDIIDGGAGSDFILGGDGNDIIRGSRDDDVISDGGEGEMIKSWVQRRRLGARRIRKRDLVETDRAGHARRQSDGRLCDHQRRLDVEQLHQPLGRARGALDLAPHFDTTPALAATMAA